MSQGSFGVGSMSPFPVTVFGRVFGLDIEVASEAGELKAQAGACSSAGNAGEVKPPAIQCLWSRLVHSGSQPSAYEVFINVF